MALYDVNESIADLEAFGTAMGMNIDWMECTDESQLEDAVNNGDAEAGFVMDDLLHYTYVVENRSMTDTLEQAFSQAAASAYPIPDSGRAGAERSGNRCSLSDAAGI